ncbi:MAG: RES family NAD+ phosphorylase [Proteobacteria bacterium]|nr:RES family NAD+ phosphorylase [Pseudomonadota bacterium]
MATEERHGVFATWRGYWNFQRSVSRELRYVRTSETEAFLAAVLETSASRRVTIPAGQLYWRAQLGHAWRPMGSDHDEEIPCAYPADRMKPLPGRAWDGRANPRGIPCLYMASSMETAMSEVRPWIGSLVSVGQFRTQRELTVVDCSRHHTGVPFHFEEPEPEARANAVWRHIDRAFAEPMTRSDDQADYTATQILAELFKHAGLDGVVYRSNFGSDGFNIALFDPDVAELVNCGLYKTKAMQPEFEEADPFYTVVARRGDG